jgi:dihydroorotate dehydrogenase electron transfer subunit
MAARTELAVVAGVEAVAPYLWLLSLDAPAVAPQVRPGQFVLVRCTDPAYPAFDPFLPRAYFVFAADQHAGRIGLLVHEVGRGSAWLARRHAGDAVALLGPVGQEVRPARGTRHLLLLADGTVGVAALALFASEVTAAGRAVTLVANATAEGGVPPELLRPDVEYRSTTPPAGGLLGALPEALPWADEVIVAGPAPLLETVVALRRGRLEPFTLRASLPIQALLLPTFEPATVGDDAAPSGGDFVPCGAGWCGACTVATRVGPRLYCRAGPAFALESLRFDASPHGRDEVNLADEESAPDGG